MEWALLLQAIIILVLIGGFTITFKGIRDGNKENKTLNQNLGQREIDYEMIQGMIEDSIRRQDDRIQRRLERAYQPREQQGSTGPEQLGTWEPGSPYRGG